MKEIDTEFFRITVDNEPEKENIKKIITLNPKNIRDPASLEFILNEDESLGIIIDDEVAGKSSVDVGNIKTLEQVLDLLKDLP